MKQSANNDLTGKRPVLVPHFWLMVWGLGLAGQLCWNIENQWFNTFVYAKIAKDSNIVAFMVMTSALVATFSTFFFGTLSDRLGSRRRFVAIGYIGWGILTIAFGLTEFLQTGTVGAGAKMGVLTAVLVILTDDVMTFFGSMGNDGAYNAWTNDNTTGKNRGQIGAALAVLPIIGTIMGTVLGGMLIGGNDNYQRLFWVMGIFVIVMGILSLLFMRDAPSLMPHREGRFWQQFGAVFNFKTFFAQKELALACGVAILFFIPFNVYFVHMGNWMIYHLGFTADKMGYVEGLSLGLATLLSIPAAWFINHNKTPRIAAVSVIFNIIGLWLIYGLVKPETVNTGVLFSGSNVPLFIGTFLAGSGLILMTQSMGMWIKSLYPPDSRGQFEGIRVIAFTLIPMIVGTWIGNLVIRNGAGTVVNDLGITENIPTESVFLWAAILLLPSLIPLYAASKRYYKRVSSLNP
jgi:MFS family permease